MPRILCTLPNASTEIGGVKFEPHPKGMVSAAEVEPAEAERLCSIKGFELVAEEPAAPAAPAAPAPKKGAKATGDE